MALRSSRTEGEPAARLSLAEAAREVPHRIALVAEGRYFTFSALACRVGRVAQGLRSEGRESPPQPVGLVGTNDLSTLLRLYALMELGVPVALVHPSSPATERRSWLTECDASLLDLAPGGEAEDLPLAAAPEDDERCLAIVRTSGSSGYPKGVVLSRRAFVAAAVGSAKNLGWQEEDRWLLSLPVAHVGGLSIITRCLLARRTVVVAQPGGFAAQRVADDLVRWRISLISLVPTMLRRLLELPHWSPPASLRALLLGGAAAPLDFLERAVERGVPVLATWGLTEACSQVTTQPYGSVQRGEFDCGPPLDGMEVRIDEGRIFIRGPQLLSGYLSITAPSPWDAEGWFATGDSGRLDAEGRLHVFGRSDEVIISGGENVHPQEVEAVLLAHAEIVEALVFGLEDADWGQVVVAVLVAAVPGVFGAAVPATLKEAELRSFVGEHLASFKRPRRVFWWQELPKTMTGKVDREGIRRRCMELLQVG